jgi:hypothetical protein
MQKESLLEKAKKVRPQPKMRHNFVLPFSDESLELALAWVKGEITTLQIARVINPDAESRGYSYNVLYRIASLLREAYEKKLIKIELLK